MESPDRVERLAVKKAKAKAEAQRTDAYTRKMFAESARIRKAEMAKNPDNNKAVAGDSAIMKKRLKDAGDVRRYESYARLGKDSTRQYNPYTKGQVNGPVVEAKPSASVQKMLKKKKSY